MAKLPKVKNNRPEEIEDTVTVDEETTTPDTESVEDQGDAVDSIINRTAETVSSVETEDDAEDEKDTESNDSGDELSGGDTNGDDFGVTISAPKSIKTKTTTVRIATVCDHSCHIGGKPYHFKKGVPTNVPEPVKQILKNAGLLAAL